MFLGLRTKVLLSGYQYVIFDLVPYDFDMVAVVSQLLHNLEPGSVVDSGLHGICICVGTAARGWFRDAQSLLFDLTLLL